MRNAVRNERDEAAAGRDDPLRSAPAPSRKLSWVIFILGLVMMAIGVATLWQGVALSWRVMETISPSR